MRLLALLTVSSPEFGSMLLAHGGILLAHGIGSLDEFLLATLGLPLE
jgi:hypothetical protein